MGKNQTYSNSKKKKGTDAKKSPGKRNMKRKPRTSTGPNMDSKHTVRGVGVQLNRAPVSVSSHYNNASRISFSSAPDRGCGAGLRVSGSCYAGTVKWINSSANLKIVYPDASTGTFPNILYASVAYGGATFVSGLLRYQGAVFERYWYDRMALHYLPAVSSSTNGNISMAYLDDPNESMTTAAQMLTSQPSTVGGIWAPNTLIVNRPMRGEPKYCGVSTGTTGAASIRLQNQGAFWLGAPVLTSSFAADGQVATLIMDFVLDLYAPVDPGATEPLARIQRSSGLPPRGSAEGGEKEPLEKRPPGGSQGTVAAYTFMGTSGGLNDDAHSQLVPTCNLTHCAGFALPDIGVGDQVAVPVAILDAHGGTTNAAAVDSTGHVKVVTGTSESETKRSAPRDQKSELISDYVKVSGVNRVDSRTQGPANLTLQREPSSKGRG